MLVHKSCWDSQEIRLNKTNQRKFDFTLSKINQQCSYITVERQNKPNISAVERGKIHT